LALTTIPAAVRNAVHLLLLSRISALVIGPAIAIAGAATALQEDLVATTPAVRLVCAVVAEPVVAAVLADLVEFVEPVEPAELVEPVGLGPVEPVEPVVLDADALEVCEPADHSLGSNDTAIVLVARSTKR